MTNNKIQPNRLQNPADSIWIDAALIVMKITRAMMRAARAAEFAHHQRTGGGRFRPLADPLLQAVIDAAISAIGMEDEPGPTPPPEPEPDEELTPPVQLRARIVRASKPKPRCYPDR